MNDRNYIEDKILEKTDFTSVALEKGDYEGCSFVNCNFLASDISEIHFIDCAFTGCNLGNANITQTAFRDVKFKDCKLLGLHFETSNHFLFSVQFENCMLNLASFHKLKLKKIEFHNSSLHEVDFAGADLTSAVFNNCDLQRAVFEQTILEKADFRTSFNYSIDPEINKIKKARFSIDGLPGLLSKYDILIDDHP